MDHCAVILQKKFLCLCFLYHIFRKKTKSTTKDKKESQELDFALIPTDHKNTSVGTLSENELLNWDDIQSDCTELDFHYFENISKKNGDDDRFNNNKKIR